MAANAFGKLIGGRSWLQVQFAAKCFHTNLVLAQCKRILSLAAVAAHQETMSILPAAISYQNQLAYCPAGCVALLAIVDLAEPIERFKVDNSQTLALQNCPLLIWILLKQITLVKTDGGFILCHSFHKLVPSLMLLTCFHTLLKFIDIQPDLQIKFEVYMPRLQT